MAYYGPVDQFYAFPNAENVISNSLNQWIAQTFLVTQDHDMAGIRLYCCRYNSSSDGIVTVSLRAAQFVGGIWAPTGSDLASATIDETALPAAASNVDFIFETPYPVGTGGRYTIVWSVSGATSDFSFRVYSRQLTSLYANGWLFVNYGGDGEESWDYNYSNQDTIFYTLKEIFPPLAPTTPIPANNTTDISPTITEFTWEDPGASTPNAAIDYNVGFAVGGEWGDEITVYTNSINLSDAGIILDETTNYEWYVVAHNDDGVNSDYEESTIWTFTTGTDTVAPEKPINPTPVHTATGVHNNVLTWEDGGSGTTATHKYYVYLYDIDGTATWKNVAITSTPTYCYAAGKYQLAPSTTYTWRVDAFIGD
jgi:hypothetical protein